MSGGAPPATSRNVPLRSSSSSAASSSTLPARERRSGPVHLEKGPTIRRPAPRRILLIIPQTFERVPHLGLDIGHTLLGLEELASLFCLSPLRPPPVFFETSSRSVSSSGRRSSAPGLRRPISFSARASLFQILLGIRSPGLRPAAGQPLRSCRGAAEPGCAHGTSRRARGGPRRPPCVRLRPASNSAETFSSSSSRRWKSPRLSPLRVWCSVRPGSLRPGGLEAPASERRVLRSSRRKDWAVSTLLMPRSLEILRTLLMPSSWAKKRSSFWRA